MSLSTVTVSAAEAATADFTELGTAAFGAGALAVFSEEPTESSFEIVQPDGVLPVGPQWVPLAAGQLVGGVAGDRDVGRIVVHPDQRCLAPGTVLPDDVVGDLQPMGFPDRDAEHLATTDGVVVDRDVVIEAVAAIAAIDAMAHVVVGLDHIVLIEPAVEVSGVCDHFARERRQIDERVGGVARGEKDDARRQGALHGRARAMSSRSSASMAASLI